MKKFACFLLAAAALSGCGTFTPEETIEDLVDIWVVAANRPLEGAILQAAYSRKWTATVVDQGTIRLELVQRTNHVLVEIRHDGRNRYSVHVVECNIPAKKYRQWMEKLRRSIEKYAR